MSVFVDTGVVFAHHDRSASRHEDARVLVDAILDGEYGHPYTSDYVYDETVTLTRRRTGSFEAAKTVGDRILGRGRFPEVFETVVGDGGLFRQSVAAFERYDDQDLSFTDAATLAVCDARDVDCVASFDDDFDGLVERVESA